MQNSEQILKKLNDFLDHHHPQGMQTETTIRQGPVTGVVNNPMTWISLCGLAVIALGSLIYTIYSTDSKAIHDRILTNTAAIEKIQKTNVETQNVVLKMQAIQEQIGVQIGKLAESLEQSNRRMQSMELTRFTDKDGENFNRAMTDIKTDIKGIQNEIVDLKLLKSVVLDNQSELKDRRNFMDDVNARLRTLEKESYRK